VYRLRFSFYSSLRRKFLELYRLLFVHKYNIFIYTFISVDFTVTEGINKAGLKYILPLVKAKVIEGHSKIKLNIFVCWDITRLFSFSIYDEAPPAIVRF
jgi:hypothetical protein